jgi:hypothetical protein
MRALLGFSLLLVACQTSSAPEPSKVSAAPQPASSSAVRTPEGTPFGTPITGGDARKPLAEVLKAPDTFAGKTVLVEGHVRKACSRKGCWMELAESADPKAAGCRVTFKDYGFFVPTDSAGSEALVEGTLEVATVKARHVEHLEEEGASFSDKQSDGTAREVRLVATGVELRRL